MLHRPVGAASANAKNKIFQQIAPARGADCKVDIAGTMQIITTIVEGWIREHPEQWLWLHRRWR